jgi:uncharacterized protein (TIGR03086 family)
MSIELLETASANFLALLDTVDDSKWGTATACEGWDVTALVDHMIGGAQMSSAVLVGGTKEEAIAAGAQLPSTIAERRVAVKTACAAHIEAFRKPGALETIVHHPAMDMPGAQLLNFRIGDYLMHSWDLAHGLGQDVTLDPAGVEYVWESLQPMAPMIGHVGVFGSGPSGTVPETAPLQTRLLDLTGRRP